METPKKKKNDIKIINIEDMENKNKKKKIRKKIIHIVSDDDPEPEILDAQVGNTLESVDYVNTKSKRNKNKNIEFIFQE